MPAQVAELSQATALAEIKSIRFASAFVSLKLLQILCNSFTFNSPDSSDSSVQLKIHPRPSK